MEKVDTFVFDESMKKADTIDTDLMLGERLQAQLIYMILIELEVSAFFML